MAQNAIQELKGFRVEEGGDITLEPAWHKARAFMWLLGIRQKVLQQNILAHETHLKRQLNDAMQLIREDITKLMRYMPMQGPADQDNADEDVVNKWTLLRAPWTPPAEWDDEFPWNSDWQAPRQNVDSWTKGLLTRSFGAYQLAAAIQHVDDGKASLLHHVGDGGGEGPFSIVDAYHCYCYQLLLL